MALTAASMKTFVLTALSSAGFTVTPQLDSFIEPLCQGIINEITTNAQGNGADSNGDTHSTMGIL